MTSERKLMTASAAVRELAMAGIRLRHAVAGEREVFLRYAMLTLGVENAVMVYPDARPPRHSDR